MQKKFIDKFVLYHTSLNFGFTILLKKWAKEKRKIIPFWGKKTEEKQNSATIMTSVDGKGMALPVKLKLQGESFE